MNKKEFQIIEEISELVKKFRIEDQKSYYDRIFNLLKRIIDFKYAAIFLLDEDKEEIVLTAQYGKAVDLIKLVKFEFGKGFSAWVAKKRKPIFLNNLKPRKNDENPIRSFISMPILLENHLIGVMNFGHEKSNAFEKKIRTELEIVTSLLAGLFYRNKNEKKLSEQNQHIKKVNQKLQETQKKLISMEKKATLSAIAVKMNHEINNPLMIISGNLQLLKNQTKDSRASDRIETILEQLDRISRVVQKLRELEEPLLEEYLEGDSEKMIKFTDE